MENVDNWSSHIIASFIALVIIYYIIFMPFLQFKVQYITISLCHYHYHPSLEEGFPWRKTNFFFLATKIDRKYFFLYKKNIWISPDQFFFYFSVFQMIDLMTRTNFTERSRSLASTVQELLRFQNHKSSAICGQNLVLMKGLRVRWKD